MLKIVALACLAVICLVKAQNGPPPFLQKAPAAVQKEFEGLFANAGSMTDAAIDKMVKDWVAKQSAEIKTAFAAFEKEIQSAQAQGEAAHQAAIAKFSPAAKEADAKLTAIANDRSKTNAQKGAEIDGILKALPEKVRKEIEDAMKG
uniref:SXP n=1 Tax=Strongylus vulgaris TaxID=40348 RepID=M1PUH1_STRVU|nr:SXP [Strongylus vulgaris]